jgi:hypothetical protein
MAAGVADPTANGDDLGVPNTCRAVRRTRTFGTGREHPWCGAPSETRASTLLEHRIDEADAESGAACGRCYKRVGEVGDRDPI